MNKAYLKRLIFRLFALIFAFGVVYSVQNPALAVRPQEGWFVRDTMTSRVSGVSREYFIIDNKMTSDNWYIEMQTAVHPYNVTADGIFTVGTVTYDAFAALGEYYWGFSDTDWRVDSDWLALINIDGVSYSGSASGYMVYVFDRSKLPIFNAQVDSKSFVSPIFSTADILIGRKYNHTNFGFVFGDVNNTRRYTQDSLSLVFQLGPEFTSSGSFYDHAHMLNSVFAFGSSQANMLTVNGTSINDLCVCVMPACNSSTSGSVLARVSVAWAIPVDKAPSGTKVGDRWPVLQPIPVEIQGAMDDYKAWKDNALAQTPVADAAEVTSQIEGYNQQLDAADNWGELETDAWNEVVPILDSFDFVFTILGIAAVVFVLLLFIKKGMA